MNTAAKAFIWMPPEKGRESQGIDVSSQGVGEYKRFSPFSHSKKYQIPVPGQEELRADSVEGIWQGLKVIGEVTDFSLFLGKPKKRKGQPEGHLFGEELLDYGKAREKIYVPAYIYQAVNGVLGEIKEDLEGKMEQGQAVMFDVESNNSIKDLSSPYSHAALLVDLLNVLKESPLPPFNKQRFTYLQEQLEETLEYRRGLREKEKGLLDEVITFAYLFSGDDLKATFALRAMESGEIEGGKRLRKYCPTEDTKKIYDSLR